MSPFPWYWEASGNLPCMWNCRCPSSVEAWVRWGRTGVISREEAACRTPSWRLPVWGWWHWHHMNAARTHEKLSMSQRKKPILAVNRLGIFCSPQGSFLLALFQNTTSCPQERNDSFKASITIFPLYLFSWLCVVCLSLCMYLCICVGTHMWEWVLHMGAHVCRGPRMSETIITLPSYWQTRQGLSIKTSPHW